MEDAFRLASVPFFPAALEIAGYRSSCPVDASRAIPAAARDRTYNMFRGYLQTAVLVQIRAEKPDLVGSSLTSSDQVVASLTGHR